MVEKLQILHYILYKFIRGLFFPWNIFQSREDIHTFGMIYIFKWKSDLPIFMVVLRARTAKQIARKMYHSKVMAAT